MRKSLLPLAQTELDEAFSWYEEQPELERRVVAINDGTETTVPWEAVRADWLWQHTLRSVRQPGLNSTRLSIGMPSEVLEQPLDLNIDKTFSYGRDKLLPF
jgi:hypothetical protein